MANPAPTVTVSLRCSCIFVGSLQTAPVALSSRCLRRADQRRLCRLALGAVVSGGLLFGAFLAGVMGLLLGWVMRMLLPRSFPKGFPLVVAAVCFASWVVYFL
jgi:hypothetical protein